MAGGWAKLVSALTACIVFAAPASPQTFGTGTVSGPFSFDGFNYGFGGLQASDGNSVPRIFYNAIFNRLFNFRTINAISQAVPNQGQRLSSLLPQAVQDAVNRDVDQLVGRDALDRYAALLYGLPSAAPGRIIPAGCVAPILSFTVHGGNCSTSLTTGQVTCAQPSVTLAISPLQCNGFFRIGASFVGPIVRPVAPLSPIQGGYLGGRPGVYDFGTAINLTRVQLGYSPNVQQVLSDFGVTRWYEYLVSFLGFVLLRASNALLVTPLPTLLSAASNRTAAAAAGAAGNASAASASSPGAAPASSPATTASGASGGTPVPSSPRAASTAAFGVPATAGGAAAAMDAALQAARSTLQVSRTSMASPVLAALSNPDALLSGTAQDAAGAGLSTVAGLLSSAANESQAAVPAASPIGNGSTPTTLALATPPQDPGTIFQADAGAGPAASTPAQPAILSDSLSGAGSAGAADPGSPAGAGVTSTSGIPPLTPTTTSGVLYSQLDDAWRQLQPGLAGVFDDAKAGQLAPTILTSPLTAPLGASGLAPAAGAGGGSPSAYTYG